MSSRSAVRDRWTAAVTGVAAELLPEHDATPSDEPRSDLVLRVHTLAEPCPAKAYHDASAPYEHNAAVVARRVGVAALAGGTGTVVQRVSDVISSPADLDAGLAQWLRSLGPAGRAPVASAARSWIVDSLARANPSAATAWCRGSGFWKHPTLGFALSATADAVRRDPSGTWRLYATRPGAGLHDAEVARFIALSHALRAGFEAESVRFGYRRTGTVATFEVGADGLEVAVEELRTTMARALECVDRPAVPGPSCRHCSLADSCEEGAKALELFRHRLGG